MKFTITNKEAAEAVKKCLSIVGRKMTRPILSCLRVKAEEGEVRLLATDLDRWMECRIPAEIDKQGECSMSGKMLAGILSNGKSSTVEVDAKGKVTINSDGATFRFPSLPAAEFPPMPAAPSEASLTIPASAWLEAANATMWASSDGEGRLAIEGTFLTADGGYLLFVATDGRRLARHKTEVPANINDATVPTDSMRALCVLAERGGEMRVAFGDGFLFAECGGNRVATKLNEIPFPNWRQAMPPADRDKTLATVKAGLFLDVLTRVSLMADSKSAGVRMDVSGGKILLTANGTEDKSANATAEAITSGKDVKILLFAAFLAAPFRAWGCEEIEVEIEGDLSPAVLRAGKNECVIMPMRPTA